MSRTLSAEAFIANFLGNSPRWYKLTIVAFLLVNPLLFHFDSVAGAWLVVAEFIFTLAMALQCYPLLPGGLITLEAILIGMAPAEAVYAEALAAIEVILLLVFMVAGVYFLKNMLVVTFTKLLIRVRSKLLLSLLFAGVAALLSAFLDALTVIAVVITVTTGFYGVYHRVASGKRFDDNSHDVSSDDAVIHLNREVLDEFRAFLRSLVMHAAVGTALGGVVTVVGEPQNLLIATRAGWSFMEFFWQMAPVSMPVLVVGLVTCALLEMSGRFGYGTALPPAVREVLVEFDRHRSQNRTQEERATLVAQAAVALFLVLALVNQWATIGLVGLAVIVFATSFSGVVTHRRVAPAFREALPFTALLLVFFAVVAIIHQQHLFHPITSWVLSLPESSQAGAFFVANGLLSAISDNVFVATLYIDEVRDALDASLIGREHFDALAVSINMGTNLLSVATPNGQAAFLFLLTSTLSPLIRLSYLRMVVMALPYAVMLSVTALLCVIYFVP